MCQDTSIFRNSTLSAYKNAGLLLAGFLLLALVFFQRHLGVSEKRDPNIVKGFRALGV